MRISCMVYGISFLVGRHLACLGAGTYASVRMEENVRRRKGKNQNHTAEP